MESSSKSPHQSEFAACTVPETTNPTTGEKSDEECIKPNPQSPARGQVNGRLTLTLGDTLAEWLSLPSLYRSCKRAAACFAAKAKSPAA
jgi:hypothetical protein